MGAKRLHATAMAPVAARTDKFDVSSAPTNFIEELTAAARGSVALVVGDRKAADWFDFSLRGLAGSFIALLAAIAIEAYVPALTGNASATASYISPGQAVLMNVVLLALQSGVALLLLKWMKRQDAFIPYFVTDNWASFFTAIIAGALRLLGVGDTVGVVFFLVLLLIIEINIARLIMTLSTRQIVLFLVGQTFIVGFGFILVAGLILPVPPDMVPAG